MQKLYYEYESMKDVPTPIEDSSSSVNKSTCSYKQYLQNRLDKKRKVANGLSEENEISKYLVMPIALEVESPLEWWGRNT